MGRKFQRPHSDSDPDELEGMGPAMLALTPKQRAFVRSMLETGKNSNTFHARAAGYIGDDSTIRVTAWRVAHDPKVLAAVREEGIKRMQSTAIIATCRLVELMEDPDKKVALKAIDMVLNRVGMHERTEHKLTVEHTHDESAMIARISNLAKGLGLDPVKLLGSAGVKADIIDGEFEEVPPVEEW